MRIATPMRGCQCFPSFRHKEINKNTLREALPFLFWKPRDVTTLCATFASQDGGVLSSQHFCLIFIIILEVSVNIDINCGCESLHNNTQVKLVEYYVKLVYISNVRVHSITPTHASAMLETRICWDMSRE